MSEKKDAPFSRVHVWRKVADCYDASLSRIRMYVNNESENNAIAMDVLTSEVNVPAVDDAHSYNVWSSDTSD